jgi:hypothetical protein
LRIILTGRGGEMKIDINIDTRNLKARVPKEVKRLAYGTAAAINETVKAVQSAERVALDQKFKIRQAGFMYRLIKINQFASTSKGIPFAEVGIDNTKARVLLSIFQGGGEKQPAKGKNVAVPVTGEAARPSFSDAVASGYTFTALQFKKLNLTQAGHAAASAKRRYGVKGKLTGDYYIWGGKNRTFILPHTKQAPDGGVFQRVGPGRDDIRLIYSFKKAPRLAPVFDFIERARKVIAETWDKSFERNYRKKGV